MTVCVLFCGNMHEQACKMHAVDVVFLVIPRIPSDKNVKEAISGPRTVSDVKKKKRFQNVKAYDN
jgi:N-acetyl-gamma-glutamylphosphate reductase